MNRHIAALFATVAFAATSVAHADTIHALGDQDPAASNFYVGGVGDSVRSWRFTANAADIVVSELGVNTPQGASNTTRIGTLWDYTTSTILAQTAFTSGSGWLWNDIDPVALTAGHDYLVSYYSGIADYYFGSNVGASWFPNGDIQYVSMTYCNGCGANSLPGNVLGGYQYGLIDIGYQHGQVAATTDVPEPGVLSLVAVALLGAGLARRRTA